METDVIFCQTSLKDLKQIISETIREELTKVQPEPATPNQTGFATRKEACQRLKIGLNTLHTYTIDGTLKGYKIGGRILYKWEEIDQSVKAIQSIKYKKNR